MSTFVSWAAVSSVGELDDPYDIAYDIVGKPDEAVRVTVYDQHYNTESTIYLTIGEAEKLAAGLAWAIIEATERVVG